MDEEEIILKAKDVLYKLHGDYVDHPRYGMQFQVAAYEKMMPNDESTLIRYFSSSLFPGIGVQTAKSIVEALGEDAIEIIKENPETLKQITTLNARKRASIIQGIMEHEEADDSVVFFTRSSLPHQGCHIILCAGFMYGKRGYLYNAGTDTETVL